MIAFEGSLTTLLRLLDSLSLCLDVTTLRDLMLWTPFMFRAALTLGMQLLGPVRMIATLVCVPGVL